MSFRLKTVTNESDAADDWPLPLRRPFLRSRTLERLEDDIRRYCAGEITGRSYLIAGHRGTGKTSLALRAIDTLRYQLLQAALNAEIPAEARRLGLQRPLLVKLHGPGLLEPAKAEAAKPPPGEPEKRAAADGKDAAAMFEGGSGKDSAARAAETAKAASPTPAQLVLKQITISLYRQLAEEAAYGYALKARRDAQDGGDQSDEVAAQLVLDLDAGVGPATLRSYWDRIKRLQDGVLWPRKTDEIRPRIGPARQGLREVLALATAGQAFQVCTGQITQEIDRTLTTKREASSETKISPDIKALVGGLGSLGLGALSGAALWSESKGAAVGAGLLVWLLGAATLSWTISTSRKREQTDSYKFLPDKNVETLDRDLPLVIQRVREAGLAPVFVIDELDKLEHTADQIGEIIGRLKHIIADFGFFCFLTDRGYYDYVDARLQATSYPSEHTYFTERNLIVYGPDSFRGHLREVLEVEGAASDPDTLARELITLYLTQKSRLNFADLGRAIGHLQSEGVLRRSAEDVLRDEALLVPARVQLAIDLVLRQPGRAGRVADDPGFAQLLFDALYSVSRAWDRDHEEYDGSRESLEKLLGDSAKTARDQSLRAPQDGYVSPADRDEIIDAHAELIERLQDFSKLSADLLASGDADLARVASLVAPHPDAPGLISPHPDKPACFTFAFDHLGRSRVGNDAPIAPGDAQDLLALLRAFADLLLALGIKMADLQAARLLPPTLPDEAGLAYAASTLDKWLNGTVTREVARPAMTVARTLKAPLDDLSPKLTAGVTLAYLLAYRPGEAPDMAAALAAIARYPVFGEPAPEPGWRLETWEDTHPTFRGLATTARLSGQAQDISDYKAELLNKSWSGPAEVRDEQVWDDWYPRLEQYLQGSPPALDSFQLADLLAATRGEAPGALLRADLAHMSLPEWSAFTLEMIDRNARGMAPRWAVVAGLRALGFGADALLRVALAPSRAGAVPPQSPDAQRSQFLAQGGGPPRLGVLYMPNDDLDANAPILSEGPALLYVRHSEGERHDVGLNWLTELQVLNAQGTPDEPD